MIDFSDPWSIIGWGLVYIAVGLIVIMLFISIAQFWRTLKEKWRYQKAHAGKLKCEVGDCGSFATHRTPNGFYCGDHRVANSTKYTAVGSWSWSDRLDYLKEK